MVGSFSAREIRRQPAVRDSSELKAFVQHKTPSKMAAGKRTDPLNCLDGTIIIGKIERCFL